jgi:hypothetical protein
MGVATPAMTARINSPMPQKSMCTLALAASWMGV